MSEEKTAETDLEGTPLRRLKIGAQLGQVIFDPALTREEKTFKVKEFLSDVVSPGVFEADERTEVKLQKIISSLCWNLLMKRVYSKEGGDAEKISYSIPNKKSTEYIQEWITVFAKRGTELVEGTKEAGDYIQFLIDEEDSYVDYVIDYSVFHQSFNSWVLNTDYENKFYRRMAVKSLQALAIHYDSSLTKDERKAKRAELRASDEYAIVNKVGDLNMMNRLLEELAIHANTTPYEYMRWLEQAAENGGVNAELPLQVENPNKDKWWLNVPKPKLSIPNNRLSFAAQAGLIMVDQKLTQVEARDKLDTLLKEAKHFGSGSLSEQKGRHFKLSQAILILLRRFIEDNALFESPEGVQRNELDKSHVLARLQYWREQILSKQPDIEEDPEAANALQGETYLAGKNYTDYVTKVLQHRTRKELELSDEEKQRDMKAMLISQLNALDELKEYYELLDEDKFNMNFTLQTRAGELHLFVTLPEYMSDEADTSPWLYLRFLERFAKEGNHGQLPYTGIKLDTVIEDNLVPVPQSYSMKRLEAYARFGQILFDPSLTKEEKRPKITEFLDSDPVTKENGDMNNRLRLAIYSLGWHLAIKTAHDWSGGEVNIISYASSIPLVQCSKEWADKVEKLLKPDMDLSRPIEYTKKAMDRDYLGYVISMANYDQSFNSGSMNTPSENQMQMKFQVRSLRRLEVTDNADLSEEARTAKLKADQAAPDYYLATKVGNLVLLKHNLKRMLKKTKSTPYEYMVWLEKAAKQNGKGAGWPTPVTELEPDLNNWSQYVPKPILSKASQYNKQAAEIGTILFRKNYTTVEKGSQIEDLLKANSPGEEVDESTLVKRAISTLFQRVFYDEIQNRVFGHESGKVTKEAALTTIAHWKNRLEAVSFDPAEEEYFLELATATEEETIQAEQNYNNMR